MFEIEALAPKIRAQIFFLDYSQFLKVRWKIHRSHIRWSHLTYLNAFKKLLWKHFLIIQRLTTQMLKKRVSDPISSPIMLMHFWCHCIDLLSMPEYSNLWWKISTWNIQKLHIKPSINLNTLLSVSWSRGSVVVIWIPIRPKSNLLCSTY